MIRPGDIMWHVSNEEHDMLYLVIDVNDSSATMRFICLETSESFTLDAKTLGQLIRKKLVYFT